MRSNDEFRELAWKRLWTDKWFGRLFGGSLLLGLCGWTVQAVINGILERLHVQSWQNYAQAVLMNLQDQTTPIPNLTPDFISQATSSSVLVLFFSYLMAGIAAYGGAVLLRKCLVDDERDWLRAAFGGFSCPFEMLWMYVRLVLTYLGWFLLFPPLVLMVFYRYRFVFLVKADHPELGADACFRRCRELMKGNKMKSFRLDCSYWRPISWTLVLCLALTVAAAVFSRMPTGVQLAVGAFLFVGLAVLFVCSIVLSQYIGVGQGFLYQEIKDRSSANQERK